MNRDITDYTNVDGVMIEDFAEYGNENFLAPSDWALQMSRAIMLTNLNKIMIYQNCSSVPYHHAGYERLFDTASYLLVKGNYTYMNMNAAGPVQWWPEYNIPIGAPTQALPSTVRRHQHNSLRNLRIPDDIRERQYLLSAHLPKRVSHGESNRQ